MKLIIQIPCFNEENTLPQTIADLPRIINGIDTIEILIIDDGSSDRTAEIARDLGVDHILVNKRNQGLAKTFRRGLQQSVRLGADIIVNTDGDNQYAGSDIEKLVAPILNGDADLVIGDRQTENIPHFSQTKKFLQWFGSGVVRRLAGIWVPDTVSGFRAFSREAAQILNIVSPFSYTIETVIQAGKRNIAVASVPVRTNAKTRESRLFKGLLSFIFRQASTIARMYAMYQPFKVFFTLGGALMLLGMLPVIRFLVVFLLEGHAGYTQSLVLGGALILMGFIAILAGMVADLISFNRQLLEDILFRIKKLEEQFPPRPREIDDSKDDLGSQER